MIEYFGNSDRYDDIDPEERELVWECFTCAAEFDATTVPGGWFGNYHPLCNYCADSVFYGQKSSLYKRLTYHYSIGNIMWLANLT